MRLYGQRWLYRIGNQTVTVDNAFSWTSWAQERMLVNDETSHSTGGYLVYKRDFDQDWLTTTGEGLLRVRLSSGLVSLICEAELEGNRLFPDECFVTVWSGPRNNWPENSMWKPIAPSHVIRIFRPTKLKSLSEG